MGRKLILSSSQAGFSLIELLVVIAVLAVLSVGAALSTGRPGAQAADMARFEQSFTLMQALAIQGRAPRGLTVEGPGLRRARLSAEGWQLSAPVHVWSGRVVFARPGGTFVPGAPDIRFLPNGRTSAFSIGFATGGRCESDGWSGVTCSGV